MKSFIKSGAIFLILVSCSGPTREEALSMSADEYLTRVAAHPLAKTETIRVSRSLAAVEKSFKSAAASCLRQSHSFIDAQGGLGYVTVDHVPRVFRDGTGVVLEIRQNHNGPASRLFLAKARKTAGGTVVTMGGPKVAHGVIFDHVGGFAQGRNKCFKYPSETGLLGTF